MNELSQLIGKDTVLVSISAVNNETGVIQPMEEIGGLCAARGVLLHSDATQALGKIYVNFSAWNVAAASCSAHKIYGPKGIGALFLRRKPAVKFRSVLPGGGQQRGIRGGTIPVPLCVGFGEACKLLGNGSDELARISALSERLINGLSAEIQETKLNGSRIQRVPHIVNMSFRYIEGESIAMGLDNVCVSTGSACASERLQPSHVLEAMHANVYDMQSSIRFGIGRFTTEEDIDYTIAKTVHVVQRLRDISPLWDMFKEGKDFYANEPPNCYYSPRP
jgi:cysteine desulfurase